MDNLFTIAASIVLIVVALHLVPVLDQLREFMDEALPYIKRQNKGWNEHE